MRIRSVGRAAVFLACFGLLLPPGARAAAAPVAAQGDISLREGGLLVGQVVDARGAAIDGTPVAVKQFGKEVAATRTDKNGVFAVKGLRGGEYQLIASGGQVTYRLWAAGTAPPKASSGALVVTGDTVLSGQSGYPGQPVPVGQGGVVGWIKQHPMVVAGGIAAAIAIPIAVADDDDPSS